MPGARAGSAACFSRSCRVRRGLRAWLSLRQGWSGDQRASDIVPDSEQRGLIGALPRRLRPYASLIRLDRPIGAWLLFWPCAWSVALAGLGPQAGG